MMMMMMKIIRILMMIVVIMTVDDRHVTSRGSSAVSTEWSSYISHVSNKLSVTLPCVLILDLRAFFFDQQARRSTLGAWKRRLFGDFQESLECLGISRVIIASKTDTLRVFFSTLLSYPDLQKSDCTVCRSIKEARSLNKTHNIRYNYSLINFSDEPEM